MLGELKAMADSMKTELEAGRTKEGNHKPELYTSEAPYEGIVKQLDVGCGENRILVKKI